MSASPATSPNEKLEAARALCREGRFAEGIDLFKQIVAAEPGNAAAHNFMGMALDRMGKPIEALPCFDRAIAADPKFSDALANKADALSALGRYREAIKIYDQALGIDENNAYGWLNRGVAFFATSDYKAALSSLDRALAIEPRNTLAMFNRARTLAALARFEEEAECVRGILAIEPDNIEALLLLGSILLRQEKAAEAIQPLDKALEINPKLFSAHVGRGHALIALGRPEEAIESYAAASALRDDVAELHAGRSHALSRIGQHESALIAIDRAIELDTDSKKYHAHRVSVLQSLGRGEEADESLGKAAALSESDALFHLNRGMDFLKADDLKTARESFVRALELDPKMLDAMLAISEIAIQGQDVNTAVNFALRALNTKETKETRAFFVNRILSLGVAAESEEFRAALAKAMFEVWTLPRGLFGFAAALIRNGPAQPLIDAALKQWPEPFSNVKNATAKHLKNIAKDKLFISTLVRTQFASVEFEKFLTLLRRHLLELALDPGTADLEELLPFTCALAQQCYINEYVFRVEDAEAAQLQKLVSELKSARFDSPTALFKVAVAGAYMPLQQLFRSENFRNVPQPPAFADLVTLQLTEAEAVARIRAEIPKLTEIDDAVSIAVREQYEEMPYPRWVKMPEIPPAPAVERDLKSLFPFAEIQPPTPAAKTEVLVAGCGTGRQLPFTTRYPNSNVLAVDLSLSSLSYAKMKMDALGEKRISFGHADILKLGSIGKKFDVIFSTGVLHHMKDPEAGWGVLVSLLKPAGFMHIGLYSELARAEIVKARKVIAERKLPPAAENIRKFRQEIGFGEWSPLSQVSAMSDFFTLNETRDLLFHVQEQNFTIPRIARFLEENNLAFIGFDVSRNTLTKFAQEHPGRSLLDLDAWHEFELANPDTFIGMYNFWVQKRKPN